MLMCSRHCCVTSQI